MHLDPVAIGSWALEAPQNRDFRGDARSGDPVTQGSWDTSLPLEMISKRSKELPRTSCDDLTVGREGPVRHLDRNPTSVKYTYYTY